MATGAFSLGAGRGPEVGKEVGMPGRMKALLVLLGAFGFAAMNGSLPWGP